MLVVVHAHAPDIEKLAFELESIAVAMREGELCGLGWEVESVNADEACEYPACEYDHPVDPALQLTPDGKTMRGDEPLPELADYD